MTFQPHLPLIIDSFAGGGGASTGIEEALGRSPDVAINHNAAALALHAANHPETLHLDSNIWDVDPLTVTKGRHVGLLWASPDCKHFSKAKGGAPRDRNIRDLAWVVVKWAEEARPDVICMENVEEFVTWGPVGEDGRPIREFSGITFEAWIKRLKRAGYRVQWRELRACDYGAPTIRKRWFLIARRDGRPIVWPKPTHGDPKSAEVRKGKLRPWRAAAECIDWTLPCPSIFDSSAEIMAKHGLRAVRPLAANTQARIARGMARYVLEAEQPFLVNLTHGGRVEAAAEPFKTITGAHRGEKAVVDISVKSAGGFEYETRAPILSHLYTSNTAGGEGSMKKPVKTVTAGGNHHMLVSPSLQRFNGGATGQDLREPMATVTANSWIKRPGGASKKDQNSLIAATMVQTGYGERQGQAPRALDIEAPLGTVVAGGAKHAPVAAWFAKYYGTGDGARTDEPMHTITVKDRMAHMQADLAAPPFAPEHHARARQVAEFLREHGVWDGGEFVTLTIGDDEFVVVDIGMRMLTPRELFRAQGFPEDYVIEGHWTEDATGAWNWHPFSKDVQVSCCGNSVCPPLAEAIVRANCGHIAADAAREMVG